MTGIGGLLSALFPKLFDVVDQAVEDKDLANQIKADLQKQLYANQASLTEALSGIVKAELNGRWYQRIWRPLLMLNFMFLINAYWFGWTPPNLSEARIEDLFDLVKIGVGGYIGGRSAEKVAGLVTPALSKRKGG